MKTMNHLTISARHFPLPNVEPPAGGVSPPPPPPSPAAPPPPPGAGKFYEGWSPEVIAHIESSGYPDAKAVAEADMNGRKLLGVPHDQLIKRPAQPYETDPKPHLAALDVLGRPKEAKAYIDAGIFKLPDGLGEISEAEQKATADVFHQAGLLPWQSKMLMEHYGKLGQSAMTAQGQAAEAARQEVQGRLDAYKAEMGGKYDPAVRNMQDVIRKFDRPITGNAEELKAKGLLRVDANGVIQVDANNNPIPKGEFEAWLDSTGAGDDPFFMRMFSALAERFAPSGLVTDGGRQLDQPGSMTKAQAAQREAQLRGDKDWMKKFTTRGDPDHAAAVEEMNKLMKIQHG